MALACAFYDWIFIDVDWSAVLNVGLWLKDETTLCSEIGIVTLDDVSAVSKLSTCYLAHVYLDLFRMPRKSRS
jgi:hypothetical protein